MGWGHTDGWSLLGQEVSWNEVRKARQAAGRRSPLCLSYLLSFTLKVRALLNGASSGPLMPMSLSCVLLFLSSVF